MNTYKLLHDPTLMLRTIKKPKSINPMKHLKPKKKKRK